MIVNFTVFLYCTSKILRIEVMNLIRRIFKRTYRTIKEKFIWIKEYLIAKDFKVIGEIVWKRDMS